MANLDSPEEIKKLDSKNLAGSVELLGKQCEQVYEDIAKLTFSNELLKAKNIVVVGMGGSAIGAHIVSSLYFGELKVPLEIVNGYHIPGYVSGDSLIILSSYSGTTEEVLAAYEEAKSKKAKILAISSGGELAKQVLDREVGGYVFEPKFNPCGQPRMGLGYSIFSQILILTKLGFLKFSEEDFKKVLAVVDRTNVVSKMDVETSKNKAKEMASRLFCKMPVLFGSEHLVGSVHIFANQINENAKTFSVYFALPEANHHLIEGLVSPVEAHERQLFLLLKSNFYSPRVQKRYGITKAIVENNGIEVVEHDLESGSRLEQVFEFLAFGSWVSFYLAMLYGRDPSPIPMVDFLKGEMVKE